MRPSLFLDASTGCRTGGRMRMGEWDGPGGKWDELNPKTLGGEATPGLSRSPGLLQVERGGTGWNGRVGRVLR